MHMNLHAYKYEHMDSGANWGEVVKHFWTRPGGGGVKQLWTHLGLSKQFHLAKLPASTP